MSMEEQDNYRTFEANYNKLVAINAQRVLDLKESIPFIKDAILLGIAKQELLAVLNEGAKLTAPMEVEKDGRK